MESALMVPVVETDNGRLPPFVVYRDGTVYSVHQLEGEDMDRLTILLVPSHQVRDLADGYVRGVTCLVTTSVSLFDALNEEYEDWAGVHYCGPHDTLKDRRYPVVGFNGGEKALGLKADRFFNRRAEAAWELRTLLEAGHRWEQRRLAGEAPGVPVGLALPPAHRDQLIRELCAIE